MNPLVIAPIFEIGKTLIDRFFPDPEKKREAEMELVRMAADGELRQVVAQLEINAREAAHPSIFVAGWRPFCGWAGGFGVAYAAILQPILVWLSAAKGWPLPPDMNTDLLWAIISGMLGIGGLRTFEKSKGLAK